MPDQFGPDRPGGTGRPQTGGPQAGGQGGRPAQVLHLSEHAASHPGRVLAGLRAYWQGLRGGRVVPDRVDVTVAGLGQALDYAFILERIAPGAARLRLAGRHLIDLMGMEVRGMPVAALFAPPSRGRLSDVLEGMFQTPQLVDLTLFSAADYGNPPLHGRLLLLPLKSDLGDVTRALGCLVTQTRIGRAPRRFDLTGERITPVIDSVATPPGPAASDLPRGRLRKHLHQRDADLRDAAARLPDNPDRRANQAPTGDDWLAMLRTDARPTYPEAGDQPPTPPAAHQRGVPWLRLVVDNG
ncbi:MAG: PAS domain-containing protein [Paracoccus sp. (in: a-proteobacteria)]|nr:PAS domain-containing protein [Paracoccus sp. (in: a-proteobacteria)]